MASFVLSFFPLDVLDEIGDLIESVSEGFLTSSCKSSTHQYDPGPVSQNRLRREFVVRSSQRCVFLLHLRTLFHEIIL